MVQVERKIARRPECAKGAVICACCQNCAALAYHAVKDSLPHSQFEKMVVTSHKAGARMGDLCHSSREMQMYRKWFHKEAMDCLSNHVGSTLCAALIMDKVTIGH